MAQLYSENTSNHERLKPRKKTIRFLVECDKNIKNANILILGLTFKENCPDIRNTKVLDIIDELEDYGCCIDIYDPWVDISELKRNYD